MNRKFISEEKAVSILRDQKKSGLSMAEYVRRNNLKLSTFHGWKTKYRDRLEDESENPQIPPLIPVRISEDLLSESREEKQKSSPLNFLRFPSGHVLEFQAEVSGSFISEIAAVLK